MGRKISDLIGKKYGRLTVIEYHGLNNRGKSMWKCRCECGNTSVVLGNRLTSGHTKSCGCYSVELTKDRFTTHGMSNTRLYQIWQGMLKRCNNEKSPIYKHYGERGIRVCDEWRGFEEFCNWAIHNGYSETLTLDRIDNNGNYSPNNCRWVDMKTQERNTSRNRYLTFRGETRCLMEWAEKLNINYRTLQDRICVRKWSIERAFLTPVVKGGN